jgi:hypothetical protein
MIARPDPRFGLLRSALLALLAAAALAAAADASPQDLPAGSTPLTISYQGSFDLTNTMIPSGTQHSYVYHVEWAYSWSGTWGELFPDGTGSTGEVSFHEAAIGGSVHVTWRHSTAGPDVKCTLRIVPEAGDYPDFRTSVDAARGTVRIAGLEAPVYRFSKFVGSTDPMCGGGPEIDVYGPPAHWNPRGDGGAVLSLSNGGVHHYDRNWNWGHSFGGGLRRSYLSSMRSTLLVSFSRPGK